VKPLEKVQLKNWRDYLEFEMGNGSEKRAVVLFERCVIACALYEEFWMKVHVSEYLSRACCAFLIRLSLMHRFIKLISCGICMAIVMCSTVCCILVVHVLTTPCGRQLELSWTVCQQKAV